MAKLITSDYCCNCPYFEVRVAGDNTPEEFVVAMNDASTQSFCKHEDMCDRAYQYVREKCKEAQL